MPEVAHGAEVHEVQGAVRTELDLERPVDPVDLVGERLVRGCVVPLRVHATGATVRSVRLVHLAAVEGELRQRQLEGPARPAEVHQLDVVAFAGVPVLRREPEVAFAGNQRRASLHHAAREGVGGEVRSHDCHVGRLQGERSGGRLREMVEDVAHRPILQEDLRRRQIVARSTEHRVVSKTAGQFVFASAAEEVIISIACVDGVGAAFAKQRIVAAA